MTKETREVLYWKALAFPSASNAPQSCRSTISGLKDYRPVVPHVCGHEILLRDCCWRTWRTSQAPCWTPCSLPTEQTGHWMMQSTWNMEGLHPTRSGYMQRSCLWTSVWYSTLSFIIKYLFFFNFLTDRRQQVSLEKITFSTWTISTGTPQRCVLFPLLFSRLHLRRPVCWTKLQTTQSAWSRTVTV